MIPCNYVSRVRIRGVLPESPMPKIHSPAVLPHIPAEQVRSIKALHSAVAINIVTYSPPDWILLICTLLYVADQNKKTSHSAY